MKKHLSFHSLSLLFTPLSLPIFSLLLLASCGGNATSDDSTVPNTDTKQTTVQTPGTLNEERTFAHNVWNSQTPEVFEIDIRDSNAFYTITYAVALDTAVYRYETVPFYTDIYTPDGTHRHLTPEFPIKHYGRWMGEMRGGYRVVTKQLYEYFPFSKTGLQRIEVRQATSQFDLEGIHSFTINIKKADLDFEKMRNDRQ